MDDVIKYSKGYISLFVPSLGGGGAERITVLLANELLEQGYRVDLVLTQTAGAYLDDVDDRVNIVDLKAPRVLRALPSLVGYLKRQKPDRLISALNHANVVAVVANILSRHKTKVLVVEHNTLSMTMTGIKSRLLKLAMKFVYPSADYIAGVSQGAVKDLTQALKIPAGRVHVLYNPVVSKRLKEMMNEPPSHPWFLDGGDPVFVGIGRLTTQKNFDLLINAFAVVNRAARARLVIFGEGELRRHLENKVNELKLGERVSLPGFTGNPFSHLRRSVALVLSSHWEGLPTVLIEAMACGARVISTDCPSGPSEILEQGKWGSLVPVGDEAALAGAMLKVLVADGSISTIERAEDFSVETATQQYLRLLGLP